MSDNKHKSFFTEIFITQSICIVLIIIIIFVTKFFYKAEFKKLEKFYKDEICSTTTVEEVLSSEKAKNSNLR